MRRRTLHEAKIEVAKAYAAQEAARQAWVAVDPPQKLGEEEKVQTPEAKAAKREWGYCEHNVKKLLQECAADPELRKHMTCARIRFEGPTEPLWVTEERQPTKEEMTTSMWGGTDHISTLVRAWANEKDLRSSGSGSGRGGWDIEYDGSYEEVVKLCDEATEKFSPYIVAQMLRIRFCLDGWDFKNFRNADMKKLLVS